MSLSVLPKTAVEQIMKLREQLVQDRFVFIPGQQVHELLGQLQLDSTRSESSNKHVADTITSTDSDQSAMSSATSMKEIHPYWDQCAAQTNEKGEIVYPFKKSLVSFYKPHQEDFVRVSGRSFEGNDTLTVENVDPTTVQEADRDTGVVASHFRVHSAWPRAADTNNVILGLQRLIFSMLPAAIGNDANDVDAYEAMMIAYRVTKTADGHHRYGEPGPEGIHQDVASLTAIMLLNRDNVTADSGGNRVWSLAQACGKPSDDDLVSDRCLTRLTLRDPLDMLLVLDRQVKHEACPIVPLDATKPAVRDVLTFEVRR